MKNELDNNANMVSEEEKNKQKQYNTDAALIAIASIFFYFIVPGFMIVFNEKLGLYEKVFIIDNIGIITLSLLIGVITMICGIVHYPKSKFLLIVMIAEIMPVVLFVLFVVYLIISLISIYI